MIKRLFHMLLFITASMTIIIVLILPTILFNGSDARAMRKTIAMQTIAPQRLFIASWRNIKSLYIDPSMNNQDWEKWKYRYLKHIKTDEDVVIAVNTMLASLNDEHSVFFDKKHYELQETYIKENSDKQYSKLKSKLLNLHPNAKIQLRTIAGMVQTAVVTQKSTFYKDPQEGDIILSINNYEMNGLEMNSAVKLIRGTSNISKVKILRNNKLITLSIVRGAMGIEKLDAQPMKNKIVYVSIFSLMGQNAPSDFRKIMQKHKDAKGYIIDLRGDVGGLFLNAVYIADELIEDGEIVTIEYRDGNHITINAEMPSDILSKPIVILINNKTASSSEILAGALRSNQKAILVGEPSFGKNVIQQIIPMPNNTSLNLTTAKYKFNNGFNTIEGTLEPDYNIKITGKDIVSGNDPQLQKAFEVIDKINKKK